LYIQIFYVYKKTVCRRFLLNTIDISEKLLRYTRDNKVDLYTSKSSDSRGNIANKIPTNKTPYYKIKQVEEFTDLLPAVSSHYCRKSSSKKYVCSDFNSLNHIYKVYVEN